MREFVSNKVHVYRKKLKITQEDLANGVGVTRQTIIAIEKSRYTPSVLLALKIARFFDTSLENIFSIDKYEN